MAIIKDLRKLFISMILSIAFLGISPFALAHGLNIYAWLDNDKVIVQADYGANMPAAHATITIFDNATKRELLSGKTSENGQYSFTVPETVREGHGLVIDVNDGQGHRKEWSMEASELYAAASLTAGFDEAKIDAAKQGISGQANAPAPAPQTLPLPGNALTAESLKPLLHEALEVQLAPIRKEIAAQKAAGPGMIEILGGIGWIIGLIGVALYFISRKKTS